MAKLQSRCSAICINQHVYIFSSHIRQVHLTFTCFIHETTEDSSMWMTAALRSEFIATSASTSIEGIGNTIFPWLKSVCNASQPYKHNIIHINHFLSDSIYSITKNSWQAVHYLYPLVTCMAPTSLCMVSSSLSLDPFWAEILCRLIRGRYTSFITSSRWSVETGTFLSSILFEGHSHDQLHSGLSELVVMSMHVQYSFGVNIEWSLWICINKILILASQIPISITKQLN